MLTIIYGNAENSIYNTNVYFKNTYEPEWIESELAKKIIKDVDDSDVLSGECIKSPVLGQIPPERLSGGVKTLLLMLNEQIRFQCIYVWGQLCKVDTGNRKAERSDDQFKAYDEFGKDTEFEIRIENGGEIVHSMRELIPVASRYLNQMKQE